jgi:hypothetical protein
MTLDLKKEKELFSLGIQALRENDPIRAAQAAESIESYGKNNSYNFNTTKDLLAKLRKSTSTRLGSSSIPHKARQFPIQYNIHEPVTHATTIKKDFCIALFTFNSRERSTKVLTSLKISGHINEVEVFIDGPHASPKLTAQVQDNIDSIRSFDVRRINARNGNYGFRRIMIESLLDLSARYRRFVILEDDCFPTKNAIPLFKKELDLYESHSDVLTVYGSHFNVENEFPLFPRFQGWGWATWSHKIIPYVHKMMRLYLLSESDYLAFINATFDDDVKRRIDTTTPPRCSSYTTRKFFAWDETLAHLSALERKMHRPTETRCIYNFGMDQHSTHFPIKHQETFRKPPFNLISPDEVWEVFN